MPTYATYVDRIGLNRQPHYVTVRQLVTAEQLLNVNQIEAVNDYIANISAVLSRTVNIQVENYMPLRVAVSGYLSGMDDNGNELGEPQFLDSALEISLEIMQRMVDTVQSREDLTIETVTWKYVINQNIFNIGASNTPKLPNYASKKSFVKTWASQEVNCAAYAITYALNYQKKWSDTKMVKEAKDLQDEFGWGEYVSISQIIEAFPKKFPQYRITVVIPNVFNLFNTGVGEEFDCKSKNYIYLVFDSGQKHFGATLHPGELFRKLTGNKDYRVCFECNTLFTARVGHDCELCTLPENTCRKRKQEENYYCKACDEIVFFIHNCLETKCRNCPLKYKKVFYFNLEFSSFA